MGATDLAYAGAAEQARLIRHGEASAREVVAATLARIERVDAILNAYRVVLSDQALAEADAADAHVRSGHAKPLLGVPVAIKDDVDVAGQSTNWGVAGNDGIKALDSEVVARLRAAGAVIIGKTNCSELTILPFTETIEFGATHNPWNTDHTPGGSSGGSGAAVAAGLCGVALGSDGLGSIRIPSSFNGVFGIKPQRDRIPLGSDHADAWNGLSVQGPIARTVADAAVFLDATADDGPPGGYLPALADAPTPLRIALAWKPWPPGSLTSRPGEEQRDAIETTAAVLRALGHTVIEREVDFPRTIFPNAVTRYVKGIEEDLAKMPKPELAERRTRRLARYGWLLPAAALRRARSGEASIARRINSIFEDVDVVLTPAALHAPWRIGELHGMGAVRTLEACARVVPHFGSWNVIGQPAASVPIGFDEEGLPLAVQLCGRPHDEVTLLRLAAQLEEAQPWADQRPPVD